MWKLLKKIYFAPFDFAKWLVVYSQVFGTLQGFSIFVREIANDRRTLKVHYKGLKNPIYLRLNSTDIPSLTKILTVKEYLIELAKEPKVIIDALIEMNCRKWWSQYDFTQRRKADFDYY